MTRPRTLAGAGTRWRASSSLKIDCSIRVAPLPPYSSGQERPAQPASCIFFCQARRNSNSAWSSPSGAAPGLFSSSQLRTSSRKAASESVSVRSTAGSLSDWPTGQSGALVVDQQQDHYQPHPGDRGADHAVVLEQDGVRGTGVLAVVDQ